MIASVSVHTVVLTWGLISFGNAVPNNAPPMPAMPVELLTTEEYNQITRGDLKSKDVTKPRVKAEKVEPVKRETKAEAPVAKQDVKPTAAQPPKPAEAPKPEPKPEPAKAEPAPPLPKPDPKPKPVEAKAPEPAPAPEKPKVAEKPPVPAPPKRPEPPKEVAKAEPKPQPKPAEKKVEKPEREFSPDAISALLDKRKPSRTERSGEEISQTASAGTDTGTAQRLSVNEQQALVQAIVGQVSPNWNVPIGARGASDLQVVVRFQLNPDGTLNGNPTIMNSSSNPFFSAAADAALRALYLSAPLRDLPAKSYSDWRDVIITLDPTQVMGG
jgi:outer membrane biosynthesis protein TonB